MRCRLCLLNLLGNEGVPLFENGEESVLIKLITRILQIELAQDDISTLICNGCWYQLDEIQSFCHFIEDKQNNLTRDFDDDAKVFDFDDEDEQVDGEVAPEVVENEEREEKDGEEDPEVDYDIEDEKEIITSERVENLHFTEEIIIDSIDYNDEANLSEEDDTSTTELEHDVKAKDLNVENVKAEVEEYFMPTSTSEDEKEINELRRSSRQSERKHSTVLTDHNKKELRKSDKGKSKEKNTYKPTLSKEEYSRRRDEFVSKHMELKCDMCGTIAKTFFSLMTHYRVDHVCNGYVKCCEKQYNTRGALIDHINYHVDPKQFYCEICDRYYKSKYFLNTHKSVMHPQTEQVKFECTICNKGFVRKHDFNKHNIRHQGEKQYSCQICRKSYLHKSTRDEHVRAAHGDAMFVCNYCGQNYKSRENFKRHVAEHEGIVEPPVQCKTCGDWSKNKFCLRKHMDTHNRINVACEYCGRICATKRALLTHVRRYHTSQPELLHCSYCDKSFTRKRSLASHVAIHTGEKHHKCPHCPKEFRSCSNMNTHVKRDHFQEWTQAKLQRKENFKKLAEKIAEASHAT